MKTVSYLDNLVARQLPETAVIQPRPVSLFEPWPGTAVGINAIPAASEAETAVHPIHPLRQTPPFSPTPSLADTAVLPPASPPITVPTPVMRAALQPATPTLAVPTATVPLLPSPMPTPKPASPEPAQRPQKQPPANDAPAATPPAPPRQSALTPATPVNVTPASAHHQAEPPPARETPTPVIIREQITLLKHVTETPTPATPTLVEIVREQPIQPLPPTAATPAAIPEPANQPTSAPTVIHPEQIKPFIPANGRPVNHQPPVTPPEPAPTVQITIGRIEVRATPPPPAKAAQKQPRTPVLSLEDYLRQRNGGRP